MRNPVQITEVKIRLTNGDRVRARVSITINDSFMIEELKVIRLEKRYFVEFPKKRQPDGSYVEIATPINAETRRMIEQAIFAKFEKITGEQVTRRV
jgi:stage V sporulation protein G